MSTARPNWNLISRHARAVGAGHLLMSLYCVIAFGLAAGSAAVAQDAPNSLDNIEVRALPGNRIELRLVTSGEAPEPLTFTIDEPARIAIDLRDTVLGLPARRKDVGIGALNTILAAEANGRTRVVLNLDVSVSYLQSGIADICCDYVGAGTVFGDCYGDTAAAGAQIEDELLAAAFP